MSKRYNACPHTILNIDNDYTAYCFDEACFFLLQALESGKELKFKTIQKTQNHYKSFSDMYKAMGVDV